MDCVQLDHENVNNLVLFTLGAEYHIVRGTLDLVGVKDRQQGRSSALYILIQYLYNLMKPCESLETCEEREETDTQFKVSKQNSILDLIDTYRILRKAVFDESRMYGLEEIFHIFEIHPTIWGKKPK
ncbi:hypothetical protein R3W88_016360 [Solanum pinnatisectum]|uniref:Uncharacterized protein n=1 Tax=Solanum pinnatisectum TaxID=50273 RepID=A0AAV9KYB2_9SOLN|nr:hypothetical protein R3W88_016360 [Solanum pinnatisectum]